MLFVEFVQQQFLWVTEIVVYGGTTDGRESGLRETGQAHQLMPLILHIPSDQVSDSVALSLRLREEDELTVMLDVVRN